MDTFGLSAVQIDSAGAHWTAREVVQQPRIWAEIETLIAGETVRLAAFLDPLLKLPNLRILLTGAGTSAHIGECLAPTLARMLARRVDAIPTTDLVASPQSYLSHSTPTLVVSFGRSGNSPESVAALEIADACLTYCSHLVFTCDAEGALYKRASMTPDSYVILLPEASNDRGFAMTSSFTGMLLAATLAFSAAPTGGARTSALAHLAGQVLPDSMPLLQSLVNQNFTRVVYLGSKEFKGLAKEAALKMLELTDGKVVAMADAPLGFRHGPKTILNGSTLVVVFVSNDAYTQQYDLDLIGELRRDAVAGRVVALSVRADTPQHPDNLVLGTARESKDVSDLELCLPYAMFAQTLALLRSLSLGVRPDTPNAAGTVSRVVKGVSIHPWRGSA
jgi:tagatose-6-phosphate ketose/aldose isomerase